MREKNEPRDGVMIRGRGKMWGKRRAGRRFCLLAWKFYSIRFVAKSTQGSKVLQTRSIKLLGKKEGQYLLTVIVAVSF